MKPYLSTMNELIHSKPKEDRTGVGTRSKTLNVTSFDLQYGQYLPIVTTKNVNVLSVLAELLGFIRGTDNSAEFKKLGSGVWHKNANVQNPPELPPNQWLSNPWRKGEDDLGRIYGVQWRRWRDVKIGMEGYDEKFEKTGYQFEGYLNDIGVNHRRTVWSREIDQLQKAVDTIINNPESRRIIISAWNPSDMEEMALPPCHVLQHYLCEEMSPDERVKAHIIQEQNKAVWQNGCPIEVKTRVMSHYQHLFGKNEPDHATLDEYNVPRYRLNLIMYQRSADYMLGSPFNITSYGMMLNIMARMTGTVPGTFEYITGDTHLYKNHMDAAREQVQRKPLAEKPAFLINPQLETLADFERATLKDFRVFNYHNLGKLNHPTPMAI